MFAEYGAGIIRCYNLINKKIATIYESTKENFNPVFFILVKKVRINYRQPIILIETNSTETEKKSEILLSIPQLKNNNFTEQNRLLLDFNETTSYRLFEVTSGRVFCFQLLSSKIIEFKIDYKNQLVYCGHFEFLSPLNDLVSIQWDNSGKDFALASFRDNTINVYSFTPFNGPELVTSLNLNFNVTNFLYISCLNLILASKPKMDSDENCIEVLTIEGKSELEIKIMGKIECERKMDLLSWEWHCIWKGQISAENYFISAFGNNFDSIFVFQLR